MKILLAAAAVALSALAASGPAHAQSRDRVLIIYGDEKCPTSGGEEIVICARKPESERYRIPEELRRPGSSLQPSWADKARSIEYAGASGIGSCSPVGANGASGCFRQMARQARAERKAAAATDREAP